MKKEKKLYRRVDPAIWDDEKFIELGDDAQSIWLLLITGPQTCSVPGLQLSDVYTLASARRWPVERVQAALDEIARKGMVELDPKFRVLRMPNGPRHNSPESVNALKGHYNAWKRLPPSPLKWRHIASLKESIDFDDAKIGRQMLETWESTFGKEAPSKPLHSTVQAPYEVPVTPFEPPSNPLRTPFEGATQTPSNSVNSEQGAVNSEQKGEIDARAPAHAHVDAGPISRAWSAAGLPGLLGAEALRPIAAALEELKLDPLAACRAFKALIDGWQQRNVTCPPTPEKMREHIGLVQRIMRGEIKPEQIGAPPKTGRSARAGPSVMNEKSNEKGKTLF